LISLETAELKKTMEKVKKSLSEKPMNLTAVDHFIELSMLGAFRGYGIWRIGQRKDYGML
jgi:hypothetical protein